VCLLHSDLDDAHERAVAAELERRGHDVSLSATCRPSSASTSAPSPRWPTPTCGPGAGPTWTGWHDAADDVLVMTSAGGLAPIDEGARMPVCAALSRPAGGVLAAAASAAAAAGRRCRHLRHGRDQHRRVPGAGRRAGTGGRAVGGRLPDPDALARRAHHRRRGRVDRRQSTLAAPSRSGLAVPEPCPGPPATGSGGTRRPTVTDANLVAGHLDPDAVELPGHRPARPRRRARALADRSA
jgi:N-methylhydantoinase A